MAKRKIVILGSDDVLRKHARAVERFDERLGILLDDMAETMYAANGAGLAAPQVGILKRAVVIDVGDGLIELINPEIVASEGAKVGVESCLSVPDRCGTVERPTKVTVHAQNRAGEAIEVIGEGFLAVALCHELDHLDGVVYVDKMLEDVSDRYQQIKGGRVQMTKVVFMGTPEFAVPSLDALLDAGYEVVGAFTQPDRPVGRGHKLAACPVKARALERNVPVFQFEKVRTPEGVAQLKVLQPDVMVTAAFGQILTQEILDIPVYGVVNVHASLLPRHRGSAPINWCILEGEKTAGVTTMLTAKGIDTGDMLLSSETEIGALETAGELTVRLSHIGAELLVETLAKYLSGEIAPIKQDEALSSYEPMLTKEMGEIDWTRPAEVLSCQVRGLNPWPCAYTEYEAGRLKVYLAQSVAFDGAAEPGTVVASGPKEGLIVACGEGFLELLEIQAPNAKRMAAKSYLMGKKIEAGTRFGAAE